MTVSVGSTFYIHTVHNLSTGATSLLSWRSSTAAHICSFTSKASLADPKGNTLWLHFPHSSRKKERKQTARCFTFSLKTQRVRDSPWCSLSLQDSGTNIPPRPLRHQLWVGWKEVERGCCDHQGQCQSGATPPVQSRTLSGKPVKTHPRDKFIIRMKQETTGFWDWLTSISSIFNLSIKRKWILLK